MSRTQRHLVFVAALCGAMAAASADFPSQRPMTLAPGETNAPAHPLGGITTNDSLTAAQVVDLLVGVGGGASVSNVTSACTSGAFGTFGNAGGTLAFASGIVLSSGDISSIAGPNLSDNVTTGWGAAGDADLTLIAGIATFDACVIEFDLECAQAQNVTFNFQFSSDEYNEYANTQYNDPFALFIGGMNRALLPDLITPISINNVNGGNPFGTGAVNPIYYINNDCSDGPCSIDTEMDGLTTLQTATGALAGLTHIKLAISDAGDSAFDSNVFLEEGSLQCAATGACCTSASCSIATAADCQAMGGAYQGDGTSCAPDTCPGVPMANAWGLGGMFVLLASALALVTALGLCARRQQA